ncbi:MAG TPA: S8 family serine peptidase, partial [Methylomirabilota bacterium]|nr:S8 family serine peptidase [Methylomirabilota bacterium]
TAGYTLTPGGGDPQLPAELKRRRGAVTLGEAPGREAYIVQFGDDSPDSARARIARASGSIAWPLSGEGYLVRMDAAAAANLATESGEPWVAPFEPAYKLSPLLDRSASGAVDVTALLFEDGDDDATAAALRALGATRLASRKGARNHLARFTLDRTRLADAAALAGIAWLEPTPVYAFNNDKAQWVLQSGVENSRPVTDKGLRGQDQILMISDSGLRTNHEMFFDSTKAIDTWGDYPKHRKIVAYKPGMDSPQITFGDDVGHDYHGTHTSGTLAGNPDPYSGAPWSGLAKDARLYFIDLGGSGDPSLHVPDDLNDLFQPSYVGNAAGAARISSNSWGANAQSAYTLNAMQVDQFVWDHPDYLIAYASGNIGVFASVNAPATAKNCLTVGATGNGTLQNKLASFSSRGPTKDGRRKPTVMGPGDGVTSSIGSTRYTYAAYSGTSMATPAAAGAMALVRQYLTDGWYPTGAPVAANAFTPSAALLRAMAVAAGRNDVAGFRVPDNTIGYGRLAIDDVLYFPGDSSRTLLVDPADGLADGRYVEYQVQVTDPGRPLKVALCWTDAPGNPASQIQIVNDLDLLVLHDGATYRGNYLLNYASVDGGVRDSLNVEELVRLPAPATGTWTVRVEARRVLQGPQHFALCITGGVGGPAGAIALDRFEYGLGDRLDVEVIDTNASGPVTARVTSSTEPAGEVVTLTGSHGVLRGSIVIAPVPANPGDGTLAVTTGDVVTARYTDAPTAAQVVATARINVQTPTISDVHATALSATRALVSWTTDLGASSLVRYGASGALKSGADSSGFTTRHSVILNGLAPGTLYRYDVESSTPRGETSRDSLGGAHRTFTTPAGGSIALVMDDPDPNVLATWSNALAALGWNADVLMGAAIDPPLVGNSSAGLRHYDAVLWQVDP